MRTTRRTSDRPRALLLLVVLGLLMVSGCGQPPPDPAANAPQTAMRLADTWVAALPAYAATTPAADAFVPGLTQGGEDQETLRVVRRAGSIGDGIAQMQTGLESWVTQALKDLPAQTGRQDLVALRTVGLAAGRAQGHLGRAAEDLGKADAAIDEARLASLFSSAGQSGPPRLAALTDAYVWALAPWTTPGAKPHTSAELAQTLRSGPP